MLTTDVATPLDESDPEVVGQLLDARDTRVLRLPLTDLGDGRVRDAGCVGDLLPLTDVLAELRDHAIEQVWFGFLIHIRIIVHHPQMDDQPWPNLAVKRKSLREILSENLTALQAAGVAGLDKQTKISAKIKALGLRLVQASISRAMTNTVAVDLDTLEALCRAYGVSPADMLRQGYAIEVLDAHPGSRERLAAILDERERKRGKGDERRTSAVAARPSPTKRRAA